MSDADFDAPITPKARPSKPKHATIEGTATPTAKPAPAPALSPEAQEIANIIEHSPALVLTDPEKLAAVCKQMETELAEFVPDLTTDKGRKAVAAFAFKFAKSKTAIDDAGKKLNATLRAQIDAVDEVRRDIRDKFDGYRDQARKPLDDWEAAQEERKARVSAFMATIAEAVRFKPLDTAADVLATIETLTALEPTLEDFGDEHQAALDKRMAAIDELRMQAEHLQQREAEAAELVRLRIEREELVAREAARHQAEQDRIAAEAAATAAEERRKREQAAAADRVRIAEQRARDEEAAKARRQQEQQAREHQAEIDRLKRIEDERIAEEQRVEEERIARECDQQNRRAKMTAAKVAIMEAGEITEDQAREIVIAIVGNTVPNVKMEF